MGGPKEEEDSVNISKSQPEQGDNIMKTDELSSGNIEEFGKPFLDHLSKVANLSGDPCDDTNKPISDFMKATVKYSNNQGQINSNDIWEQNDKNDLKNKFSQALERLKTYLLFSMLNLDCNNSDNVKVYKSALTFLCKDIFSIHRKYGLPEDLVDELKDQLEVLKFYEDCISKLTTSDNNSLNNNTEENKVKAVIENIVNSDKFKNVKSDIEVMAEKHKTWTDKAYFIINILQIKDPTMFFKLINKTKAEVRFTAEGMVVSPGKLSEIKLHPKAYNQIGNFIKKIEKIEGSGNARVLITTRDIQSTPNKQITDILFDALKAPNEMSEDFKRDLNEFCRLKAEEINGTLSQDRSRLTELEIKYEYYRKEYFFQSSTKYANNASYMEESNRIEKQLTGGKNLEDWKAEKQNQNSVYSTEHIEKYIKEVRDYKLVMDRIVLSGNGSDSDIRNKLIKVEWTDQKITEIRDKIKQEYPPFENLKISTAQFARDIGIFSNSNYERLCYTVHAQHVESILQDAFRTDDLSTVLINKKSIFDKMNIEEYDRLNRIFRDYQHECVAILRAAKQVINLDCFSDGKQLTVNDFASICEAVKLYRDILNENDPKRFFSDVSEGKGDKYNTFVSNLGNRYKDINNLIDESAIYMPWTSPISMLYHYPKHACEFRNSPVLAHEYFSTISEQIFQEKNIKDTGYHQYGLIVKRTYISLYENRTHLGFTCAFELHRNQEISSHYIPKKGKNNNTKINLFNKSWLMST